MSILSKIFSSGAKEIVSGVGSVVDNLTVSDDEKSRAKKELTEVVMSNMNRLAETQGEVIKTEMQGGWLQRSWRPIVMLSFTALLFARWFGLTESVDGELELKLMDIIQFGLGGYVIGRSAEKIAGQVTQNIDMPFLKKKDRK